MKHVRPFDTGALAPGERLTIVSLAEGLDCAIAVSRGGSSEAPAASAAAERFVLVLAGAALLSMPDGEVRAAEGDLIFIPAGAAGTVGGTSDALWVDVESPLPAGMVLAANTPVVVKIDPARFEGQGFAYQGLIDRTHGASTMRINVVQVQPGAGSPDHHIHAFAQIYVILDGEMTIDVGRKRIKAVGHSLVVLPAGVVHRNFNASSALERHVTLLVPEPCEDAIFDYAITIHDQEAMLLTSIPG